MECVGALVCADALMSFADIELLANYCSIGYVSKVVADCADHTPSVPEVECVCGRISWRMECVGALVCTCGVFVWCVR